MKRTIAFLTVLVVIATLFASCGVASTDATPSAEVSPATEVNSSTNSDSATSDSAQTDLGKPFTGEELIFAGEAGAPFTECYKTMIGEFEERTGAKVSFFEVPHENTHERFLTEALSGSGSIDVYQLDQPWVSEFAEMGFLVEVTDEMTAEIENFDFSESSLGTMSHGGKLYGLPFQYHTPVLFYRTDLFDAAGLETPPKTWDEYREYARILNDPENGIYGTCIEGKSVAEPVTHFLDKLSQAGAHYMDPNTGEVIFDSSETREALKFLYEIQNVDKTSPEGAIGFENPDVYNLFLQGKVAMVSEWPYFYAGSQDPEQSVIVGKVGVAPQPAGKHETSALWAFGYGVSSSSKKKELAWEFCKWGTEPEVLAKFSKEMITTIPRASASEIVFSSSDMSEEDKNVLRVITEASDNAKSYTITSNFPAVQDRLATTLSSVVSGLSTIEDAVVSTQKDLEEIIQN